MVLGVICVLASIVALAVLDRRVGPAGAAAPGGGSGGSGLATWLADVGVIGTLLLWHVIGAISSDDGYNLTIARVSGDAGLRRQLLPLLRRHRGAVRLVPVVLAHLARSAPPACGCGCPPPLAGIGHLADHQPLRAAPARQRGSRVNRVAVWTGGRGVPGRVAAVQQRPAARAADRVRHAAHLGAGRERDRHAGGWRRPRVAIVVAMFSVTLAPQGLIALAPLLVGARAIARIIARRRRASTACSPRSPRLLASLSLIFVVVFRDQTLATVAESARIKYTVGPTIAVVPGVPALLLPHRRGQRRLLADPALRGAGAAAVPVRHAGGAAAARQRARHGQRARCGG